MLVEELNQSPKPLSRHFIHPMCALLNIRMMLRQYYVKFWLNFIPFSEEGDNISSRWWTCPRLGTLTVPSVISTASSRLKTYLFIVQSPHWSHEKERERKELGDLKWKQWEKAGKRLRTKANQRGVWYGSPITIHPYPIVHLEKWTKFMHTFSRWPSTRNLLSPSRPREGEGAFFGEYIYIFSSVSANIFCKCDLWKVRPKAARLWRSV